MHDETEKRDESLRSMIEAVVNDEASGEQHKRLEQRLLDDEHARDHHAGDRALPSWR